MRIDNRILDVFNMRKASNMRLLIVGVVGLVWIVSMLILN